jgi:hypothetical protein
MSAEIIQMFERRLSTTGESGRCRKPKRLLQNRGTAKQRAKDPIFATIDRHRMFIDEHERAVKAEFGAEGNVSPAEFARLQERTRRAFADMDLLGRAVLLCSATTRIGLIAWAKHMEAQFDGNGDCVSLPEEINDCPWQSRVFRALRHCLRGMGAELDRAPS